MQNIQDLERRAQSAKDCYYSSNGDEWLNAVVALRALADAYCSVQNKIEASNCFIEIKSILDHKKKNLELAPYMSTGISQIQRYLKDIDHWTGEISDMEDFLDDGESLSQYAKASLALCDILCLSGLKEESLVQYEETVEKLFSRYALINNNPDVEYVTIVTLLKTAICAMKVGDSSLSKKYCILPLLVISEKNKQMQESDAIDWHYVSDLCKEIIDKI